MFITSSLTAIPTASGINFFLFKGYDSFFPLLPPLGQLAAGCRKEPVCLSVPAELHLIQHREQLLTSTLGLQVCNHLGGKEERELIQRDPFYIQYLVTQARLMSASGSSLRNYSAINVCKNENKDWEHDCVTS